MDENNIPKNYLPEFNLPSVLLQFISNNFFWIFPPDVSREDAVLLTKQFLFSTNDDSRLKHALKLSKILLKSTDIDDAQYFRESLLRREISGNINYEKQRDHTSHTLFNYILGIYFYKNSDSYSKAFIEYSNRIKSNDKFNIFSSIWPFVSILHDIGYIFEGSIKSLSLDNSFRELKIAQDIINDHFKSRFWRETKIFSIEEKHNINKYVEYSQKEFYAKSIYEVADEFSTLKLPKLFCDLLENSISEIYKDQISLKEFLSQDIFDLWAHHFKFFKNYKMVNRVADLRIFFEGLLSEGLPGTNLRILDHGVMGGLLLLHFSTYYMIYYFILEDIYHTNPDPLIKNFIELPNTNSNSSYRIDWWWEGILWGTAATAFHNYFQAEIPKRRRLNIKEDPLTYLGILVDILQDWDRYSVFSNPFDFNSNTLQSIDIELKITNGVIQIYYHNDNISKKVKEALNKSLINWKQIVEIY